MITRALRPLRAVIFDMDDTLFDEMQFVSGGFRAVSALVAEACQTPAEQIYDRLLAILSRHGRGRTFDLLLQEFHLEGKISVDRLVNVYRSHVPRLTLYDDARCLLGALKRERYRLGLLTDGDARVQRSKFSALGLEAYLDGAVFSDDHGCCKPSAVPYLAAGEKLGVPLSESVYIGDNPHKDFVTARKLGMFTIRVLRGPYREVCLERSFEADARVNVLEEVLDVIS